MPREIPIELSSLFEKEIAISTNNPSETTELVDTKETLQKKVSQNIVKPTPVQKNQIDKTSEGNRTYQNTKRTYTVQKGDTLSKISLKFYGTSNKWKKIVDANKEKLGNSQILKSGMLLVIPEE